MAWTGDMNKYGLKYEILYPNEVWKDVSCLVSSPKMTVTENLFSSSFKSVISTTKLDLRYNNDTQKDLQQEIFSKMMEAKANFDRIGFRIKETATGKFPMNGFIDLSNITMVVGRLPRELSIEVENLITALDDDIQGSFQYPDIPVFDEQGKMNEGYCVYNPNDSANSIIPLLIMRCGLNITDLDMVHSVEILEKVPRIVYDADANTRTYRDLIDTLLYEHCAVLRQSDNGKLVISSFTYEKPEALREIAYTTENGLTMKGGDWQKDGWKIEWSTVDAVRQATVYQASITPKYDDKGEVLDSGEEIEALGYFPETGDLEPEYYEFDAKFLDRPYYTKQSRLKNKDLSLITTSNVTYELEADDRIEEVVAVRELHPLKARILLHNSDSDDVHFIRMFNMLGDCLFRKKINTYTYPEDAKKTEEYTTEFVTDEKVVNKLGSTLTSLSTHGDNTYSWTEFGQRGTVGDIVQITAPGTNISSLAVITSVSCSKANTDVWRNEYKAIGLVAYNALEPKKRSVVSGASSVEGKQGTPGNIKVEQYAIGDAIAPFTTAPEGSQSPETSMFLYNIGGEGYVLGGSDWELGEDSSWSTDIPTPSEGEYVWLRVGFYTPPALFPTVWQVTR
ncbi:MAG TPA: hypothetical protein VJ869_08270, partial [Sphaerochaeta sp.]|nr:hypothetical protein [Sphaerochaeta sp.]